MYDVKQMMRWNVQFEFFFRVSLKRLVAVLLLLEFVLVIGDTLLQCFFVLRTQQTQQSLTRNRQHSQH